MIHRLALEFTNASRTTEAIDRLRSLRLKTIEIYAPYPDDRLLERTEKKSFAAAFALAGGIFGAFAGLGLQYWTAVLQYPLNIGGRPLASWPAFVPVTFELSILCSVAAIFCYFLVRTDLPLVHHSAFAIPGFERASQDRFFLVIHVPQAHFDSSEFISFLDANPEMRVHHVG